MSVVAGASVLCSTGGAFAATYDPATDVYSMAAITQQIGASGWWDAGYTGRGVDVAVIDTGVSPVEGLSETGKVIYGPDFSLESQAANLTNLDTNGHGTFMAGLIAGHETNLTTPYSSAPASQYRGVAPDARIVSVKVATADGGTDVTQVIAAINWLVDHRTDQGMVVRVINVSYGTNSTQASKIDPLSYAVERAWKAGIVVVAAAGNTGYQRGNGAPGLSDPAYNPYVIAVGGYDTLGTVQIGDDVIGSYSASSAGCGGCRNPDFVNVGSHLQGLRVPNSFIDVTHPEGRVDSRYFRGSGTSEAAAITSGTVALILQKYPNLSPDEVKRILMSNAKKIGGASTQAQGRGAVSLTMLAADTPRRYTQKFAVSTGSGSIELSRGQAHLTRDTIVLTGEQDVFGQPVLPGILGSSWSGIRWNGSSWSGPSWSGSSWSGSSWSGSSWSGSSWSGSSWSGSSWSGAVWAGGSWN